MAQRLLTHFSTALGKSDLTFEPLALDMLASYPWPGNIRELENVIERGVLMAEGCVRSEDLGINVPLNLQAITEAIRTLPEISAAAIRKSEVEAIARVLHLTNGNKSRTAEILGISYKTLLNKVHEYSL